MSASPFFLISSKYISTYLGFPSTQNHSMLAAHRIRPAWLSQVWALVEPYQAPDQMSVLTDKWRNFFTALSFSQLFEPPTIREDWPAIVHRTDEQVIQGAMSSSMLAVQDDETKKQVVAQLEEIMRRGEGKKWVDEKNGVFESSYNTLVAVARKKGFKSV